MKEIVDDRLRKLTAQSAETIAKLHLLTKHIHNDELAQTVKDILDRLESPFTFVIVGEVKAGKSSFINALLDTDREICKVAAHPMTDTIQQIVYGPNESVTDINDYIKKITQPEDILKEISIVDTPGTNSIVDHHQEITERYIPYSDLIVFVFEAKNPYRQSSWQFFDYINEEWRRKIIFVLQQKDLLNDDDLATNFEGVRKHATEKGIEEPLVFATSAKLEQEGAKEQSGFADVRQYITDNITGGKAPYLKISNNVATASTINTRISHSLDLRKQQWEYDRTFRNEIRQTLDNQEGKTAKQIDVLIENLLATYDRITNKKSAELAEGLGFMTVMKRSVGSIFGSGQSLKVWLDEQATDFEYKLNSSLKEKLTNGIIDVADNIQTMGKLVHAKIRDSKTILEDSDEIFADIAEKRANVLKDLQSSFADFMSNSENFYDEKMASESGKVAPNIAAGSGIAVVGVILATVTNGAVFDITGGILTTIGVLFAGATLGLKRRKILKGFEAEIAAGRSKLEWEVAEKLKGYTQRIKSRIDDNFYQLDLLLNHEENTLEQLSTEKQVIDRELGEIEKMLR